MQNYTVTGRRPDRLKKCGFKKSNVVTYVLIMASVLFGVALGGRVYEHVVVDPISGSSLEAGFKKLVRV
jgi:hypothetical protein